MGLFKRKPPIGKAAFDAQTLAEMVKHGAVLTNRRNVRHYLYGSNESEVDRAAVTLKGGGYRVEVRPAGTGGNWLALAEREEVVNPTSVAAARALFAGLASEIQGGEYDGWEAAIVEK
jgi:hypothetical protein